MKHARLSDLKEIYQHFQKRQDVFPHVRQDKLRRMIEAGQLVWQDGIVITYQRYRRAGRVAATCPVKAKAGDVILHQILNTQQFSGAGGRVFERFVEEIVKPSGGDLYLSVRKENAVACSFYERHGMSVVGNVSWSGGTLPGLVYRMVLSHIVLTSKPNSEREGEAERVGTRRSQE
jgi:hypothetical protein